MQTPGCEDRLYRSPEGFSSRPETGCGAGQVCVNLRELQAIRQSLQLKAASPPWWTSSADGQGPTLSDNAGESLLNAVYASLRGCSRSWRGVEARKGLAALKQDLQ